jgi:hypothetical protein
VLLQRRHRNQNITISSELSFRHDHTIDNGAPPPPPPAFTQAIRNHPDAYGTSAVADGGGGHDDSSNKRSKFILTSLL